MQRTLQLAVLSVRGGVKQLRSFWPVVVVDTCLLVVAGLIVGALTGTFGHSNLAGFPSLVASSMTCMCVLTVVHFLRTFTRERALHTREAGSGVSLVCIFVSENLIGAYVACGAAS
jgi:hypothetical protein